MKMKQNEILSSNYYHYQKCVLMDRSTQFQAQLIYPVDTLFQALHDNRKFLSQSRQVRFLSCFIKVLYVLYSFSINLQYFVSEKYRHLSYMVILLVNNTENRASLRLPAKRRKGGREVSAILHAVLEILLSDVFKICYLCTVE